MTYGRAKPRWTSFHISLPNDIDCVKHILFIYLAALKYSFEEKNSLMTNILVRIHPEKKCNQIKINTVQVSRDLIDHA